MLNVNCPPVKVPDNGGRRFFDCCIQTPTKNIRGVSFELSKKKEFDNAKLNKSPIKIRKFRITSITNITNSENVVMNESTQLTITQSPDDFQPIGFQDDITCLSKIAVIAPEQSVNVKAKVAEIGSIKIQPSSSGPLKKQEAITVDQPGSAKLTFWDAFTNICDENSTYLFKNLQVKKYGGSKYLNTPKDEYCRIKDTDSLEGPLAQIDEQNSFTTVEVNGNIVSLNAITKICHALDVKKDASHFIIYGHLQ